MSQVKPGPWQLGVSGVKDDVQQVFLSYFFWGGFEENRREKNIF